MARKSITAPPTRWQPGAQIRNGRMDVYVNGVNVGHVGAPAAQRLVNRITYHLTTNATPAAAQPRRMQEGC